MNDYKWEKTVIEVRPVEKTPEPEPKSVPPLKTFTVRVDDMEMSIMGHQMHSGVDDCGPLRILKFHTSKWEWDGVRWFHTWETEVVAKFNHFTWVLVGEIVDQPCV